MVVWRWHATRPASALAGYSSSAVPPGRPRRSRRKPRRARQRPPHARGRTWQDAALVRPEDIAWSPDALAPGAREGSLARRVCVRWLGTAGFAIEHDGRTLLVDPYVTRASLARCIVAPLRPDVRAIARHVPQADAIVLGHTHFDHALDAPAIARM